jgi:uncharacterized membrane protein
MDYNDAIQRVGEVIDAAGVAIMFAGAAIAPVSATVRLVRHDVATYRRFRQQLGQAILLGLELLVAGDIVRTVAAQPSLTSIGVLAGIVVIRTFLSFSLEVELTGRWPWQSSAPMVQPEEPEPPRRPRLRDRFSDPTGWWGWGWERSAREGPGRSGPRPRSCPWRRGARPGRRSRWCR